MTALRQKFAGNAECATALADKAIHGNVISFRQTVISDIARRTTVCTLTASAVDNLTRLVRGNIVLPYEIFFHQLVRDNGDGIEQFADIVIVYLRHKYVSFQHMQIVQFCFCQLCHCVFCGFICYYFVRTVVQNKAFQKCAFCRGN